MGLVWRPATSGDTPDRFDGYDDEGQLRGWVWRVTDERWLGTMVSAGGSERVVGQRRSAEEARTLVDDRYGN